MWRMAGVNYSKFCFSLHLLDIINRNSTTRNVLNAAIHPYKQLGMTAILMLFTLCVAAPHPTRQHLVSPLPAYAPARCECMPQL